MRSTNLKCFILLALVIIFWASAYIGIRTGLHGYSPGSLALLRYLTASISMLFVYLKWGKRHKISKSHILHTCILGILGFAIYNVALNYGEISVSAGIASFIICQVPVLMTLLAILFLNEKLLPLGWFGTCISFAGIILLALGEKTNGHFSFGVIYILIAAIAGSIYSVFQKPLFKKIHPIDFTAIAMWAGSFVLLIYTPDLLRELPTAPLSATIAAIYNGIFPGTIAYLLWSFVLKEIPAAKAASSVYIIPICTMILGWMILGEIPALISLGGGLVALIGALLVMHGVQKPQASPTTLHVARSDELA